MAHLFHRPDVDAFLGELTIGQFLEWCDYVRWVDGEGDEPQPAPPRERPKPSPEELERRMMAAWGHRIVEAGS